MYLLGALLKVSKFFLEENLNFTALCIVVNSLSPFSALLLK